MPSDQYDDVQRELGRVVDRLAGMPLARVERAMPDVRVAAAGLLDALRTIDPDVPAEIAVPALGPTGQSALISVLGEDWLRAARARGDVDPTPVREVLVRLRRALP